MLVASFRLFARVAPTAVSPYAHALEQNKLWWVLYDRRGPRTD